MRDGDLAAAASGIEIHSYRLMAFLLAGLVAGLAGVLYAHNARYVSPDTFGLGVMFLLLAMVIIGGQDSIWGAVVGAVLLIGARNLLTGIPTYQQIAYGGLIVATVVFAPRGLAGAASDLRRRFGLPWPTIPIPWSRRSANAPITTLPVARPLLTGIALRVDDVSKQFRGLHALSGVSLEVPAGQIHGVIGPNGSGKTTLFNVISGIYRPNGGRVLVWGRDVTGQRSFRMSRLGIGAYVPEPSPVPAIDRARERHGRARPRPRPSAHPLFDGSWLIVHATRRSDANSTAAASRVRPAGCRR